MTLQSPTVTVVIPLFQGASYICETLRSVLDQSHHSLEVLVIDDGSTDDGVMQAATLLDDPRLTIVLKDRLGIARTRNIGLAHANSLSRFIMFVDQDDILAPDTIERLVHRLEGRPDAAGAFVIADYIDGDGRPLDPGRFSGFMRDRRTLQHHKLTAVSPEDDVVLEQLFFANHIYPPSAVLMRTRALRQINGFDAAYQVADDWDALIRLARVGPLLPVDEVKVGYRRHGHNASGNTGLNVRETRAVWANTYFSPSGVTGERAHLRAVWRAWQRERSSEKSRAARALLRESRIVPGLRSGVDALAHLLLLRPLRSWQTSRGPSPEHVKSDSGQLRRVENAHDVQRELSRRDAGRRPD